MIAPLFSLERWPHGWLFCSESKRTGIPMNALSECMALFPKGAVMDAGIAHHMRTSGKAKAVVCVVTPANSKAWRAAIDLELANAPAEQRWFTGTDTGTSSTAIFACFCETKYRTL